MRTFVRFSVPPCWKNVFMQVGEPDGPDQQNEARQPHQPLDSLVALKDLSVAVQAVVDAGVSPLDGAECVEMLDELEVQVRRLQAMQVELFDEIDTRQLFTHLGLFSAKAMVQHRTRASGSEVSGRRGVARMLREMPALREAAREGLVSTCNLRRLARASQR